MGWLNWGGKKRKEAQGFGNSKQGKSRPRRKTFILEKIVTPSAGVGGWLQDFDSLHELLGSWSLSDLHLPNFLADSGVCPIDPSAPTDNLPPLIDFDPLGLYHDGIATQTPYNIGGAFETLPVAVIPVDPQSPNANDPNAIRQLLDFPLASQPLVGTIDTGVSANSPYLNYANIKKGRDYVGGDDNPLLEPGEGSEHGTFMLGIIDAINKTAPKWVGRAIDSGRWADSLVEFVDAAKASGQKNAIANLSLDLTQKNADGSVTTRYELTPQERSAIEYARQNGVMLVVAAGNDGGVMSVLGQASQEFDNIFTVGAGDINGRSIYSSYGRGLDILADGGTTEHPGLSTVGNDLGTMAGTSVATAKVAGAASLVWAANPALNYRQVMQILESTARDLGTPGWDDETGFGFLNTLAAVDLAKKTVAEVYQPTPWVTPDTWSGEGIVTPEERAAKGGNSIAEATVQVSTNFSDIDRVDSNQPQKYYQFTVTEPGYVSWNLTSLNPVSGFPTPPEVTVIKADGKPGSHTFFRVIGAFLESFAVGEGQTSFQGGNFYDPGTYYLKVGNGAGSTFNDYNISTQFIADRVSSFTGNIQYRTQPYYSLDNSLQSAVFSGPAVSELSNLSGVVTYENINFNNRIAKYGVEVNESGKIRINLNSPNGKMGVSVKKFIGSDDRPESIASLEVSANSDRWLELDLNKGRYDIEVNTPSDVWLEPDWNSTQEKLVRPYTLNATFTPNAPQPGQGKVPSSAGAFDKTVVSNGVVNHYYKNGYLTVQPSGQASWYGYRLGVVSISASAQPLNDPVPLPDPDGNYSIQTAENLSLVSGGADLGDGVNSNQVGIGYILSSIGGKDLNDFYKFSFDSLKLVNFYLSQSGTAAQWWLIQDRNGNGQVDPGEAIKTGTLTTKPLDLDVILEAGDYYLQVGSLSSDATSVYAVNVTAKPLENQVIASYNSDYYLVQNGQRRLIPNQETLTAMGIAPNTVKAFPNQDLALIPLGNNLPSRKDGTLLRGQDKVYQMQSGKRRWIPDAETFNAMGLSWSDIKDFPVNDVDAVTIGSELPSRKDGTLLRSINGDGKVYQMQSGKRRWIPDPETFKAMGLSESDIKEFPIDDVNTVPSGEDLPSRKDGSNTSNNFDTARLVASVPDAGWQEFAQKSIPRILDECKAGGITDLGQIAYILATSEHESHCGQLMTELWDPTPDQLTYDGRLGNNQPGDGFRYRGRGYTQITGKGNYQDWSTRLGIDLVNNPEKATEPAIAAKIIVQGMRDGTFTGEKLSDYINASQQEFYNARAIVNGDKSYVTDIYKPKTNGQGIADIAQRYLNILKTGTSNNTGSNPNNPPSSNDPPDFTGKVKPNSINVRSGPGINYAPPIRSVSQGTELTFDAWTNGTSVYDEEAKANDDRWFRIKGTNSWVASALINGNPPANSRYIDPNSIAPPSGSSNNDGGTNNPGGNNGGNTGGNGSTLGRLPTSASEAKSYFRYQLNPNATSTGNCGPASLAMVIAALGLEPPNLTVQGSINNASDLMNRPRNAVRSSSDQIVVGITNAGGEAEVMNSLSDIDSALNSGKPVVTYGNITSKWLAQFNPSIANRDIEHIIAILGKTSGGLYIVADPFYPHGVVEMRKEQLSVFFEAYTSLIGHSFAKN